LNAVREVDPAGRYAMAAVLFPPSGPSGPLLAVDSPRLSTVAFWPGDGDPAAAATLLRPAGPDPGAVPDWAIQLGATLPLPPGAPANAYPTILEAVTVPLAGGDEERSVQSMLRPGNHTYEVDMNCTAGCRLAGLNLRAGLNSNGAPTVVLRSI